MQEQERNCLMFVRNVNQITRDFTTLKSTCLKKTMLDLDFRPCFVLFDVNELSIFGLIAVTMLLSRTMKILLSVEYNVFFYVNIFYCLGTPK